MLMINCREGSRRGDFMRNKRLMGGLRPLMGGFIRMCPGGVSWCHMGEGMPPRERWT